MNLHRYVYKTILRKDKQYVLGQPPPLLRVRHLMCLLQMTCDLLNSLVADGPVFFDEGTVFVGLFLCHDLLLLSCLALKFVSCHMIGISTTPVAARTWVPGSGLQVVVGVVTLPVICPASCILPEFAFWEFTGPAGLPPPPGQGWQGVVAGFRPSRPSSSYPLETVFPNPLTTLLGIPPPMPCIR